jgi:nicotinate-nucleotide adenylyltransferase
MLSLATNNEPNISVSKIEIEVPHKPYTVETLTRLNEILPDAQLFFVMGSDSWRDIRTWREWEKVLGLTNHIIVTRPGYDIANNFLTEDVQERIVDIRGESKPEIRYDELKRVYFTDAVNMDIAASEIRKQIREGTCIWQSDVTLEVAKYIEKYQIYS